MKTIGLIGGMSWESTITYYQVLNETIKQVLGGLHSAKCSARQMAIGIEALKFYPMRLNLLKRLVLIILLYARIQCIK
ncbi:hypothetical protein [Veillonella parvula]|uniref:hypothetical protein n=1 Tax=Veillonella parvula TaxID=29466 RepID=UPI00241F5A73|nr:hypothetical protein [Veillonella parvula]